MSRSYRELSYEPGLWVKFLFIFTFAFAISACGGGGNSGSAPPFASAAGMDQVVNEGATVQLSGSAVGSSGALTYSWTQTSGANVILSDNTIVDPTFTAPQVANGSTEVLTFEFSITNAGGLTVVDTVDISVNDVAGPLPISDAGPDQTVTSAANVTLAGSASGNNPPFIYSWAQVAGSLVTLSDVSIAAPSFTAPTVATGTNEILTFELTVMDADGNVTNDQVTVTVTGSVAPTSRIKRVEYDYDNNGTADAITILTYDSAGRLILDEYQYTDDGTPDLFVLIRENQVTTEITYDTNGRIESHYRVDDDNGGTDFIYSYDTGTGLLARTDVVTTNLAGTVTSETYVLYTYSGTQVMQWDIYLLANDSLLVSGEYTYDGNGQIIQDRSFSPSGVTQFIRRYTWDANGRLDLQEFDGDNDGDFEVSNDYVFDTTTGFLAQRINNNSSQFANPFDIFTESFTYTGNGQLDLVEYDKDHDGSLDAVARVLERETGPCIAEYIPFLIPSVGQDGIPGSDVGDLGWCQ